jgi:NADH:ubiquinone oxidoreductase subunit F (NADH-binding)
MNQDIIQALKKSGLCGRGGASFPTGKKWEIFAQVKTNKKYIICNASEGDPQMSKDGYLLKNYLSEIIDGVKIALKTFPNSEAYIYLRKDYYAKYKKKIERFIDNLPIKTFKKTGEYLAGEETSLLEAIEGKRPEPRPKPPYPSDCGLFNKPTLINNVETFYCVAKIAKGEYKNERFYCLSGDIKNKGIFELKKGLTIREILENTKNLLKNNDYFVQMGGTLGEFLTSEEIDRPLQGLASVVVYNKKITNPTLLAQKILKFAMYQNCDKCAPCREGIYRLFEEFRKKEISKKTLSDIFMVLEETSYCPLGMLAGISISSLYKKIMNEKNNAKN